jgi:hypothetical protein
VRWQATRCDRGLRWRPTRPPHHMLFAVALTLALHGSLSVVCKPSLSGDDPDGTDRDVLILCDRAVGDFCHRPDEPPYGVTVRRKRAAVFVDPSFFDYWWGEPSRGSDFARLGGMMPRHAACEPGSLVHDVVAGETLGSIARLYGLPDWRVLYRLPENRWFFEEHLDPNRIFPGDRIVIPAPEGEIDCELR